MNKKNQADVISSSISRFMKFGGMVGKIGLSMMGEKSLSVFLNTNSKDKRTQQSWIKNAERIVKTLGQMKGGVMKIGQMMSLQEGFLPTEFTQILSLLQKEAPPVPFKSLLKMVESDLPRYKSIIESIDKKSYASASIGQVHKAVLKNGQDVVLKIQYPNMKKVITSDLKNLKILFGLLGKMMFKMDFDKIFDEVENQLLEEVDYYKEIEHQQKFIDLFINNPSVRIPKVFHEASGKHVLCSEFLPGHDINDVCSRKFSDNERNQWAENLFRINLQQLFQFQRLHTDPNIANFAFLPDGKIIIYDFGSVKIVPEPIVDSYRKMIRAFLNNQWKDIPDILKEIGICYHDKTPIGMEMVNAYSEIFKPIFYPSDNKKNHYRFHKDDHLVSKLVTTSRKYIFESFGLIFPADIIFIDRALGGLMGNLTRLGADADWPGILDEYV